MYNASLIVGIPFRIGAAFQTAEGIANGDPVDIAFGAGAFAIGYLGFARISVFALAQRFLPCAVRRSISWTSVRFSIAGGANNEFDEVMFGGLVENKTAMGLPRGNQAAARNWARDHILNQTIERLDTLQSPAADTARVWSQDQPFGLPELSVNELRSFKRYQFRITNDDPVLKMSVAEQLQLLGQRYPEYEFSASFGVQARD